MFVLVLLLILLLSFPLILPLEAMHCRNVGCGRLGKTNGKDDDDGETFDEVMPDEVQAVDILPACLHFFIILFSDLVWNLT